MFRGFTKPRNHSTLRAAQNYNLSFKRQGMTKRSMPCLFHANLYVLDGARCPSFACGAFHCWCGGRLAYSGGLSLTYAQPAALPLLVQGAACSLCCPFTVRSLPATFLLLVQRGQVTLRQKGKLRWNSSRLAVLRG